MPAADSVVLPGFCSVWYPEKDTFGNNDNSAFCHGANNYSHSIGELLNVQGVHNKLNCIISPSHCVFEVC